MTEVTEVNTVFQKLSDFCRNNLSVSDLLNDSDLPFILNELQKEFIYPYTLSPDLELEPFGLLKALNQSMLAIIITDSNECVQYVSPQAEILTGYSQQDLIGKKPNIFQSGQTAQTTYTDLFETLNAGKSWAGEFFNRRKNGSFYWEWCVISPVFNSSHQLVHYVAIKQDITQRKLIESELKYQSTLLESIIDPILSTDLDLMVLSWSSSAETFYGWSEDQVIGQNWLSLQPNCIFTDTTREVVLQQVLEHGSWSGQVIQHHAKGHELLVYMVCSLIYDSQNMPAGLVIVNRDLTQNQALQKALIESEARFKQVAHHLEEGVWSIDFNTQKTEYMSPAIAKIGNLPYDDLMSQPEIWRNHVHPDDLPLYLEFVTAPLNEQKPHSSSVEYRFITPDKQEKWLSSRMYANLTSHKQNKYWGITEDITLRKRAQDEIVRSQQFAYGILGSLSSHICVLDQTGMIVASNEAWDSFAENNQGDCNYLGWNYLDVCQNAQGQESPQALLVYSGIKSVLDGSQDVFSLEYPCHCKQENRWFELKVNRIEHDTENRIVVFHQNISAQKKSQESLRKLNESLEEEVQLRTQALNQSLRDLQESNQKLIQANQMKDAFLANMSHELRTPLTGILGMADLLYQEVLGPVSPKQSKSLKTLRDSGQHLLTLINDILDLSKVEAGKLELHPEWVDVSGTAQQVLCMIKSMAEEKQVRLSLKIEPFDLKLWVDPRCFKQMLVNLLSNAVKFTPASGVVGLETCLQNESVILMVIDSGIGIAEHDLRKLFQPFVQIDSGLSRKYAGTGLGLSLVKNLIEAHGGHIQVKSTPGKGSTFFLHFPLDPSKKTAHEQVIKSDSSLDSEISLEITPLILVVDDNPVNIEVIQSYLEYSNYRVMALSSGKETLHWLQENTPDLVLMDIQMPGMNGFELIDKVRSSNCEQTATLPVIALTSLAMTGDQEKILKQGFNNYLSKPVEFKVLGSMMEDLLAQSGIAVSSDQNRKTF